MKLVLVQWKGEKSYTKWKYQNERQLGDIESERLKEMAKGLEIQNKKHV